MGFIAKSRDRGEILPQGVVRCNTTISLPNTTYCEEFSHNLIMPKITQKKR